MKLFTRTNLYYVFFSLTAFLVGGIIFYHILNRIFNDRIEEDLRTEKLLIQHEISHFDSMPDYQSVYGHLLQIVIYDRPRKFVERLQDTVMFDMKLEDFRLYRHLRVESTTQDGKGYVVNLFKPLDNRKMLMRDIIAAMILLFLILMAFLVFMNNVIIRRVWIPFYRTLGALKRYDINSQMPLILSSTGTREFRLLNDALNKMSEKIQQDYQNLKEFNENAAHELQTPLAVIRSKLDLLIQNERMDESQMKLIQSVYEATNRMARLNHGLLLISKIENNQYSVSGDMNLRAIIENTLDHYGEMIELQNITVTRQFKEPMIVRMNHSLAEILINNLLSNAIRHNTMNGTIVITMEALKFSITNSGPPLNEDPGLMFERFRKSGNSPESVGLGLSIVQKICTLYRLNVRYHYLDNLHTLEISR